LPSSLVSELTLEERIAAEDAWKNLKEGRGDKAKKIIMKLEQDNPLFYAGLGYVYYILKDLALAEDYFKAAVNEHPKLALARIGLGQILQETGRDELAFSEYREILKTEPDHPWAKTKYENIRKQKTEDALYEARTLRAGGEIEASKSEYLKVLYYAPGNNEAHLALAKIYMETDEVQNALVHLKAAYSRDPQNPDILSAYAEALFLIEDNKKSLEAYELLFDLDPENSSVKERIEILKNRLGIFELPSQFDSISLSESITREEISALIGIKFKDILDDPVKKPPIVIDISTSWASKYILEMASLDILDIYPNHTFQPQKTITKAELAEILNRLILHLKKKGHQFIQQIPLQQIQISDVSQDNFYYRPIVAMVSYDIMSISLGRKFNPDQSVTGSEAIRLLDIILALTK
jgi:tetratricopeptide (TPR) repeat protein